MKRFFTRKRLSMSFAVMGMVLIGTDLMMTRNFFTHVGELMIASILCFVTALVLDRNPGKGPKEASPASGEEIP